MAGVLQHLRSSTLNKRPNPASMVDGQIAINYASGSPGAFFKDTNGNLVKVGPVHVGATAPNVSPASGGTAGNSLGEQWLDTSGGTYVFKIWDGAAWRSEAGEFVNSTGDTMTGSLTMGPSANLIFEGSTDDGFETTLTVVDPTADRTITLPNVSGTVVTTGDTGTITSTMIADGTIVNADVNASAAIAGTKISPDFGSQTIQTTGVFSHALGSASSPTVTFTGDANTGIYSPGADQVAISTNGQGRLFVDSSGLLSVGTSTGATGSTALAGRFATSTGSGSVINVQKSNDGTNAANIHLLKSRGTVASPTVVSNGDTVGSLTALAYEGSSFATCASVDFVADGAVASTDAPGRITFSTRPAGAGGANTERLRITSAGLVGVGTSSPSAVLYVNNASGIDPSLTYGATAGQTFKNGTTELAFGAATTAPFAHWMQARFSTNAAQPLLLNPLGGNVGIGTTSPASTLHVVGTAQINTGNSADGLLIRREFNNPIDLRLRTFDDSAKDYIFRNDNGSLRFIRNATEVAQLDASGRLLVGTSSALDTALIGAAAFQVAGGTNATSQLSVSRFSGNSDLPRIALIKSRSGTVGSNTIVQNGDGLGEVAFIGADGSGATGYPFAASIGAYVDGTPSANNMPGRIVLSTTPDSGSIPVERLRIRQDGNILFGKTSLDFSVAGIQTEASSTSLTITRTSGDALTLRRNTDNGDIVSFYRDGTKVGSISVTTSATAYNTSSDYRLKENVVAVTDGITRLQQLKPSRFNFIADPAKTVDGFIAHEVQTIVPEAITGEKDAVDDDGNPVYQGIDQSKLVPLLTAALQEAIGEIESLKARVAALESA